MRQTEDSNSYSEPADRSMERSAIFPDILLYRATAGDGADCLAAFNRQTVLIARPVAGLACRIRLKLKHFLAVAATEERGNYLVRLMHRDPGLTLDLAEFDTLAAAEEYRDGLAASLGLATLTLAGRATGPVVVPAATLNQRRKRRAHRPRFLYRRKTGDVVALPTFAEREIIARS